MVTVGVEVGRGGDGSVEQSRGLLGEGVISAHGNSHAMQPRVGRGRGGEMGEMGRE